MRRTSIFGTSKDSDGNVKFGAFWKLNAWNRENQVADYRKQLSDYGDLLKAGNNTGANRLLQAFTQSGATADAEAIRAAVEATGDYAPPVGADSAQLVKTLYKPFCLGYIEGTYTHTIWLYGLVKRTGGYQL